MKRKQISICMDERTMKNVRKIAKNEDRSLSYTINVLLDRAIALCYNRGKPLKRTIEEQKKMYLPKDEDNERFNHNL